MMHPRQVVTSELGIVLIGPPSVGKATQAARLRAEFDLAHILELDRPVNRSAFASVRASSQTPSPALFSPPKRG